MDAQLMIRLQAEKAERLLHEGDDMVSQQRWDMAANRYYYACYHMVHAAFIIHGISTKTHEGTLTELGKNFILTGMLDKKFGRFYSRMLQLRLKADYNSIAEVTEEEVLEMSPLSHDFVENMRPLLVHQS